MQKSIVEAFPNVPLSIGIVWVDMLPFDGDKTARKSAKILAGDPRVRQFHDPKQRVGKALAKELGWSSDAWDIYLFYPKGAEWRGRPPIPTAYVHQVGSHFEDGHFYTGEDLVRQLRKITASTVAGAPPAAKGLPKPR